MLLLFKILEENSFLRIECFGSLKHDTSSQIFLATATRCLTSPCDSVVSFIKDCQKLEKQLCSRKKVLRRIVVQMPPTWETYSLKWRIKIFDIHTLLGFTSVQWLGLHVNMREFMVECNAEDTL